VACAKSQYALMMQNLTDSATMQKLRGKIALKVEVLLNKEHQKDLD